MGQTKHERVVLRMREYLYCRGTVGDLVVAAADFLEKWLRDGPQSRERLYCMCAHMTAVIGSKWRPVHVRICWRRRNCTAPATRPQTNGPRRRWTTPITRWRRCVIW